MMPESGERKRNLTTLVLVKNAAVKRSRSRQKVSESSQNPLSSSRRRERARQGRSNVQRSSNDDMNDDDITKKFPILLEGILQDVYSQRAASAWQGAQPQKLTVSILLPGTSSAAEWRDLLQSRRQFWPTLTTRHASLVPVSAEALQRERRQMQAKHLWYNVDIRWSDLKDKLEVLAPTGLTREDIWLHLFLTKQRKNPYEEGCYTGEDVEDVKQKWEAKKHYFEQYKKDAVVLLALTWIPQFKDLTLTTLQHIRQ